MQIKAKMTKWIPKMKGVVVPAKDLNFTIIFLKVPEKLKHATYVGNVLFFDSVKLFDMFFPCK